MGRYKGYTEEIKEATLKYRKSKQHPVTLSYRKEEWEREISPAIKRSGLPIATFIKEAIREKIDRDNL